MKTPRKKILTRQSVVRALVRMKACEQDTQWVRAARGSLRSIWDAARRRRRCWVLSRLGLHARPVAGIRWSCMAGQVDFRDVRAAALRKGWWR